jgi:hypothetical protein
VQRWVSDGDHKRELSDGAESSDGKFLGDREQHLVAPGAAIRARPIGKPPTFASGKLNCGRPASAATALMRAFFCTISQIAC